MEKDNATDFLAILQMLKHRNIGVLFERNQVKMSTSRLYTFFSCVLCSSSSISVIQFGNIAAILSTFCAVMSGDSMRSFSIRFILLRCKFAKVANRIFQEFNLCYRR